MSICGRCTWFDLIPFKKASHRDMGQCASDAANAMGICNVKQSTPCCPEFYEQRIAEEDAKATRERVKNQQLRKKV